MYLIFGDNVSTQSWMEISISFVLSGVCVNIVLNALFCYEGVEFREINEVWIAMAVAVAIITPFVLGAFYFFTTRKWE